jgi:hypothetical protein
MTPSTRLLTLVLVAVVAFLPTAASACPFCDGGPSGTNEVRDAIFGAGFWFNLIAAGLPFMFILALALAIHGVPIRAKKSAPAATLVDGGVDDRAH